MTIVIFVYPHYFIERFLVIIRKRQTYGEGVHSLFNNSNNRNLNFAIKLHKNYLVILCI